MRGLLIVLVLALWLRPTPAAACGGMACDNSAPVVQAAERIIFSHNGDGTVTAVIQIQYSGPSPSFAWVLPVPGTPDVGISSNIAFTRLQLGTDPSYQLRRSVEGTCFSPPPGPDAGAADSGTDSSMPPVTVVDEGSVGPYDFVTISLDPGAAEPGDVAVDWLVDNGYEASDMTRDRLGPYLADGMNLIAFRLTKGNSAGSIRPIVLTYDAALPMIPIRPTALAVNDNMGVMVWVVGDARAIPQNYRHLVLNEALINWFIPLFTYNTVVSAAADEAGGQGFVTEMAGPTTELPVLLQTNEDVPASFVSSLEGQALNQLVSMFAGWDGLMETVTAMVPIPDRVTIQEFLGCVSCFYRAGDDIPGFELAEFLAALEENVVAPVRATEALLHSRPWVTRLYTTMSADEMTVDPIFAFNADLPEVSSVHTADMIRECSRAIRTFEAPWRIELPSGETIRGLGGWPFQVGEAMPAALRIEQLHASGAPEVIEDRSEQIAGLLTTHNATIGPPPVYRPDAGSDAGSRDAGPGSRDSGSAELGGLSGGGGCSASSSGSAGFLLLAWVLWARRRKG